MDYDVIVVGAGNGGLISACTLQKDGKKVLLVEANNVAGGYATSFVRGRFEFEAALHELCDYGSKNNPGNVRKLFNKLGIEDKLKMVDVPEAFRVLKIGTKEDYTLPFGIDEFVKKMESYVPGCEESIKDFFDLAKECVDALSYLGSTSGHPDVAILKKDYANFMRVSAYSVKQVFNALKLPLKAQEILSTYWVYLGAPTNELSFVHYAVMVYSYITKKAQIPVNRSHEMSTLLISQFESMGGEVLFNTKVTNILVDDNSVRGIKCDNGCEYLSNHVICNINPNIVYGSMIDKEKVPVEANRLANQRELSARGFSIYLGLNKSTEEIGLDSYSYFLYHSLDSNIEVNNMKTLDNDSSVVVCLNNAISDCSRPGTCILYFTSLYFSDCFVDEVNEENYFELKERIARKFIETFEKTLNVDIINSIEEIEIATPVTFARYANAPNGAIYGYKTANLDNLLPRLMGMYSEDYISGLRFCGGSSMRSSGYSSSYVSGEIVALLTLADIKREKEL